MVGFLNKQESETEDYDDALVRKMIERMTVYEDEFEIEFKAGIRIQIKA